MNDLLKGKNLDERYGDRKDLLLDQIDAKYLEANDFFITPSVLILHTTDGTKLIEYLRKKSGQKSQHATYRKMRIIRTEDIQEGTILIY